MLYICTQKLRIICTPNMCVSYERQRSFLHINITSFVLFVAYLYAFSWDRAHTRTHARTHTHSCMGLKTFVTLEHKSSVKSLGYICSNSQKYVVWVKIIDFYFMPKIIMILRSCSMKIFSKFPTVNISKLNFWLVICVAKNFIWTTLKMIFSIFRFFLHPQIPDFQILFDHNKPYIHGQIINSAFRWCINLNFKKFTLKTGFVARVTFILHKYKHIITNTAYVFIDYLFLNTQTTPAKAKLNVINLLKLQ